MAWNVEASQLDYQRHLAHALAILLTVGGTPSIYAGHKQGSAASRSTGRAVTTPSAPSSPTRRTSSPLGWGVYRLHQQLIGVRFPGYGGYPNNNRPLQSLNGRVVQLRRGRHED
jgi:hypothetical protein